MSKIVDKSGYVVDEKKIIELFLELIKVDSPSKNERQLADLVKVKLTELGLEVYEDSAAAVIKGNCGNIIGVLRGEKESKAILFSAHLDTVVSNQGVNPLIDNGVVKTDGRTILGSDDKAGITAILEAIRMVQIGNRPHGDIYIVLTVAEEIGLYGSKNLDLSRINVDMSFVLDSGGPVGTIIYNAPTEEDLVIKLFGQTAHAGVNPEAGINAIQLAGQFLAQMKMGRIDDQTTANIGLIRGGIATNVVPELVEMEGEVRSTNEEKLKNVIRDMKSILTEVCNKNKARFELATNCIYITYCLDEKEPVMQTAIAAVHNLGLDSNLMAKGGGSDANIFNQRGLACVNLGIGMSGDHTNQESISLEDLFNAVRLILSIIENVYLLQDF